MEDLNKEVKELIGKIIKRDPNKIDPNVNIFREYKVDSLMGVEILAGLDKKYGIDIPETRIKDIKSVNDIAKMTSDILSRKKLK